MRDYLTDGQKVWTGVLTGLVEEAVALGHLREDTDASQFVWQLQGIYLSHHLSQRMMRDPDADARALAAFEALVAPLLPGRPSDPGRGDRATEPTTEERQ